MPRLDAQQRRILELLSETEWRSTAAVYAETDLYRSLSGVGRVLGKFASEGRIEHRTAPANTRRGYKSEWRLVRGAARS